MPNLPLSLFTTMIGVVCISCSVDPGSVSAVESDLAMATMMTEPTPSMSPSPSPSPSPDDRTNPPGQNTPGVISSLPEAEADKIRRIQEELARQPRPIVVTPEGEFGTPQQPKSPAQVAAICANFPNGTVIIGVYISPPTPPTNSAVVCRDGRVAGQDDKKSYGEGENAQVITIRPNTPYQTYPAPLDGQIRICADIYNEDLPAPRGPNVYVIADYGGTDLAQVIRNMQLAACREHNLTTAPTVIVSNSNATGGSGTYPGFPCPAR